MPISPAGFTGAIIAAAPELKGADWTRLATAVGTGIFTWATTPSNIVLTGVTSGVAGSGVVNGTKINVVPSPLPVPAAASGVGLLGPLSPSVFRAIGMGTGIAFNTQAFYSGVSVGVGNGSDVSVITAANGPALTLALQGIFSASGLLGANGPLIASAVGTGVAAMLLGGTGIGVVTGPAGPAPAAGTSTSITVF